MKTTYQWFILLAFKSYCTCIYGYWSKQKLLTAFATSSQKPQSSWTFVEVIRHINHGIIDRYYDEVDI